MPGVSPGLMAPALASFPSPCMSQVGSSGMAAALCSLCLNCCICDTGNHQRKSKIHSGIREGATLKLFQALLAIVSGMSTVP